MKHHARWIAALSLAISLVGAIAGANAADGGARLDTRRTFTILAQPMASALLVFSRQADIQVMSSSSDLDGLTSNAVSGEYSVRGALEVLLNNSGLTFHVVSGNAVSIEPVKNGNRPLTRASKPRGETTSSRLADSLTHPSTP